MLDRNLTHGGGVQLVPMTLVNAAYFGEIVGRLREDGHTVHHVVLTASRETLLRRLRSRGEGAGSWGAAQIERCLAGLEELDPEAHLPTDGLTHKEIVEEVARRAGLTLAPDTVPRLLRPLNRWSVQLRHARGDS